MLLTLNINKAGNILSTPNFSYIRILIYRRDSISQPISQEILRTLLMIWKWHKQWTCWMEWLGKWPNYTLRFFSSLADDWSIKLNKKNLKVHEEALIKWSVDLLPSKYRTQQCCYHNKWTSINMTICIFLLISIMTMLICTNTLHQPRTVYKNKHVL